MLLEIEKHSKYNINILSANPPPQKKKLGIAVARFFLQATIQTTPKQRHRLQQ